MKFWLTISPPYFEMQFDITKTLDIFNIVSFVFTDLSRNWQQASLTSRTSRRFAAERRFWTLCLVILIEPVYANSSRFLTKLFLVILIEPVFANSSRFLTNKIRSDLDLHVLLQKKF